MLKWSRYNVVIDLSETEFLIYNTFSNSLVKVSEKERKYILKIINGNFCNIPNAFMDELESMFFLCKDDDLLYQKVKLSRLKNRFRNDNINITIAPTLSCNFACPYCFEKGNNLNHRMSDKTQDALVNYISLLPSNTKVNITWYGGEPLLAFDIIKNLSSKFLKIENHISHALMVTNGYLLSAEIITGLKDLNIKNIQVTLDGCKETHNIRRFHKTDIDSFSKIIDNLRLIPQLYPELKVNIRVNLDKNNENEFFKLLDYLKTEIKHKYLNIYPAFVADYDSCQATTCELLNRKEQSIFAIENMDNFAFEKLYYPSTKTGECIARSVNSFVIGPNGEFYKCWCDVGKKEKEFGDIFDGIKNYDLYTKYLMSEDELDDAKCKECTFSPICSGGCVYRRLNLKGNESEELCLIHKDNFKEFIVKSYYKLNK